jgi:hypothetical protein
MGSGSTKLCAPASGCNYDRVHLQQGAATTETRSLKIKIKIFKIVSKKCGSKLKICQQNLQIFLKNNGGFSLHNRFFQE